jgi:TusE/DsrC/DsvC family sulfur relay protein
MQQFIVDPQETETSGRDHGDRLTELAEQRWSRNKSAALADGEGIALSDGHWAVVMFLRQHYLRHGLPIAARVTANALKKRFLRQGGNKYLHRLFPGGPVAQGSRFANVRTPAYATDPSFGTSY